MNISTAPLSGDQTMSEFHALQPIFYAEDDDYEFCNNGASPSEDVWRKFHLDCMTPPMSPIRSPQMDSEEHSDIDDYAIHAMQQLNSICEYANRLDAADAPFLPDLRDTCNEVFQDETTSLEENTNGTTKIIKDCMWNGVGHKPHCQVRRLGRNKSPAMLPNNTATGCVDPRSVFNCGQRSKTDQRYSPSPRRMKVKDGAVTPSDSEEEIDVVTVEKKNPPKLVSKTTTLGVVSQGEKFVGTLVSRQNGAHRQLALVPANGNRLEAEGQGQIRGRNQVKGRGQQTVTMVINSSSKKSNSTKLNLKVKNIPLVTTQVGAKRRLTSPSESKTDGVKSGTRLMRLGVPTLIGNSKENFRPVDGSQPAPKRRFTLEGVSMVSDTGINQHRCPQPSKTTWVKNEVSVPSGIVQPLQISNLDSINTRAPEKKKVTKKCTKKVTLTLGSYETPTSSPDNSNVGSPTSPKKRVTTGDSSSSEDSTTRTAHNVLERQRRNGLRTLFNLLRLAVPDLADSERAPKVSILKKATDYSLHLQHEEVELQLEKVALQQKQLALEQRVHELESSVMESLTIPNSNVIQQDWLTSSKLDIYVN